MMISESGVLFGPPCTCHLHSSRLVVFSGYHANLVRRRLDRFTPLLADVDPVLSLGRFEVEVLQQRDDEQKHFLARDLLTETRTFTWDEKNKQQEISIFTSAQFVCGRTCSTSSIRR